MDRFPRYVLMLATATAVSSVGCSSATSVFQSPETRRQRLMEIADQYTRANRPDAAMRIYDQVLAEDSSNVSARTLREQLAQQGANPLISSIRRQPELNRTFPGQEEIVAHSRPAQVLQPVRDSSAPLHAERDSIAAAEQDAIDQALRNHILKIARGGSQNSSPDNKPGSVNLPPGHNQIGLASLQISGNEIFDVLTSNESPAVVLGEGASSDERAVIERLQLIRSACGDDARLSRPEPIDLAPVKYVQPEYVETFLKRRPSQSLDGSAFQVEDPSTPETSSRATTSVNLSQSPSKSTKTPFGPKNSRRLNDLEQAESQQNASAAGNVKPATPNEPPSPVRTRPVKSQLPPRAPMVTPAKMECAPEQAPMVARLIEQLKNEDTETVCVAAYQLGRLGSAGLAASDDLIEVRDTRKGIVRLHAAEALTRIMPGDVGSMRAISEGLRDQDVRCRWMAAMILGNTTGLLRLDAAEALRSAVHDPDSTVAATACLSLGGLGPQGKAVMKDLEMASLSDDPDVQTAARLAIRCLRGDVVR